MNRAPSGAVVFLAADEIERIDLTGILSKPQTEDGSLGINQGRLIAELTAALDRMRVLTLRKKPVAFAIQSANATDPGELFVRFNELVDGDSR
jgi:hypothetical protein